MSVIQHAYTAFDIIFVMMRGERKDIKDCFDCLHISSNLRGGGANYSVIHPVSYIWSVNYFAKGLFTNELAIIW